MGPGELFGEKKWSKNLLRLSLQMGWIRNTVSSKYLPKTQQKLQQQGDSVGLNTQSGIFGHGTGRDANVSYDVITNIFSRRPIFRSADIVMIF